MQIQPPPPNLSYASYKSNLIGNFSQFSSIAENFRKFHIKEEKKPHQHPNFPKKIYTERPVFCVNLISIRITKQV